MASCSWILMKVRVKWIQELMNLIDNTLPMDIPPRLQKLLNDFPREVQAECAYLYHVCKWTQKGRYSRDEWNAIPSYTAKDTLEKVMYKQYLEFNRKHFKSPEGPTQSQIAELRERWMELVADELIEGVQFHQNIPSHLVQVLDGYPYNLYQECIQLYEICYISSDCRKKWKTRPHSHVKEELQMLMDLLCLT